MNITFMLMSVVRYMCMVFFLLLICIACNQNVSVSTDADHVYETLDDLLKEAYDGSYESILGISLAVKAPDKNIDWTGATGFDARDKDNALEVDQPFRIASITKTFVATAILRLHEMDSLDIEDPISLHISTKHDSILKNRGYDTEVIKVKHCLNHTSGLYDYAMGGSPYAEAVKADPQRFWTRTEQLELAMKYGDPYPGPGKEYHYCDTGYILLGEAIERITGKNLGEAIRVLIGFEKLGMKNTWYEVFESPPPRTKPLVNRYFGNDDATNFSASIDLYGGGGLISTCQDLSLFMNGLFNGAVYEDAATLTLMLTEPELTDEYLASDDPRYKDYRYGLWMNKLYGEEIYMHGGLWGTGLYHMPSQNITVARNCTKGWAERVVKKAFLVALNLEE